MERELTEPVLAAITSLVNRERQAVLARACTGRAAHEAQALRELDGRGVPQGLGDTTRNARNLDASLFTEQAWIDGPTLEERVTGDGPLRLEEASQFVTGLGDTVQRRHDLDPPFANATSDPMA